MINHVNPLKKNSTVLMFCPRQFQKTYFKLTLSILLQSKEMSLNDVASLNVKRNEVGRKKAIRSRAPIIPKMQISSYQRNTYCELDPTNNVFPTLSMLYTRQQKRCMQTYQLQHLKQFNPLATCLIGLSKIQSHCNNKVTLTSGLILT